jgi:hydroxymethylpyrimidine/phosphomethylpyrimidine kinase
MTATDVLGMLSSTETIDVIAETLQVHKVPIVVLDPVRCFLALNLIILMK